MLITIKKPKLVIHKEWLLDISIIVYITSSTWISVLDFLPISSIWITIAIIYGLLIGYCVLNKQLPSWQSIVTIFVSIVLFAFAYFIHPENRFYFIRETYGLSRVFRLDRPIYFVIFISLYKKKPKKLLNALWISSVLLSLFGGIEFLQALIRGYWLEYNYAGQMTHFSYSLAFGYKMLLPCLVFIYTYMKKKSLLNLILALFVFGMIFVGGSRGQLICIIAFIGIVLFRYYRKSNDIRKSVFLICIIVLCFLLFVIGIHNILTIVAHILENIGISSRTLESLLSGSFTDDNSRFIIWERAIDAIKDAGFFGYGVYGDRPILSSIHYAGYCHNIFLELMVNFGLTVGLILSIIIVLRSIYIFTIREEDIWIDLYAIMFSISVQLLISMSFWYVMGFWGAVESSHYCKKKKKEKIKILFVKGK